MIQKTLYKTKEYSKVKFSIESPEAEQAEVVGLNGNWEKGIEMKKKKDGSFSVEINLPKNTRHEFKYRLNKREWLNEPQGDGEVTNVFGTTNSLIEL
jgi:1,4-alpha-glucan branching enzyme